MMLPGAHDDFFKRLGAVQAPTSTHYVFFLNELASELGDGVLNPNEHKVTANTPRIQPILNVAGHTGGRASAPLACGVT